MRDCHRVLAHYLQHAVHSSRWQLWTIHVQRHSNVHATMQSLPVHRAHMVSRISHHPSHRASADVVWRIPHSSPRVHLNFFEIRKKQSEVDLLVKYQKYVIKQAWSSIS